MTKYMLTVGGKESVEIAPRSRTEGEAAGIGKELYFKVEDLIEQVEKIATVFKSGLNKIAPNEYSLELGFSAGSGTVASWVLEAEGSIKVTLTWKG